MAKSIASGCVVSGTPSMPHRLWLRITGLIVRLPKLRDSLKQVEKRLEALETQWANEKKR